MPEVNYRLKEIVLQAVDSQMSLPETAFVKEKYEALLPKYGSKRTKEMIAAVLIGEIYDMQKQNRTYDEARYKELIGELK